MTDTNVNPVYEHKRIAQYQIGKCVGGFGDTIFYAARDEALGRDVWMGTVRTNYSERAVLTFRNKVKRMSDIGAPLVVSVHAYFEENLVPWMVCECPHGSSLQEVIQRKEFLEFSARAALAIELFRSLCLFHQKNVIVGYIDPCSVFLLDNGMVQWVTLTEMPISNENAVDESESTIATDLFRAQNTMQRLVSEKDPFQKSTEKQNGSKIAMQDSRLMGVFSKIAMGSNSELKLLEEMDRIFFEMHQKSPQAYLNSILRTPHTSHVYSETQHVQMPGYAQFARPFAGLWILIVIGGIYFGWKEMSHDTESRVSATGTGMLRVVAHPWAEVHVDGMRVDTTPMGRPMTLSAGEHYVTLKHPAASDEKRTVTVVPNQMVVLDVTMRVERPQKMDGGIK